MIRTNSELLRYIIRLYCSEPMDTFIEEKIEPKQKIIEQGKRYHWVYVIKEGLAKCYLSDENGKDFIQEFLGKGMEFGEIEVFSNKPSFCCIEAITNLRVYKISYHNFNDLLKKDATFNRLIMKSMAEKISFKAPRHSSQQLYSIAHNLLRLKKSFPDFTKVISKQDISNYLGVTLRSLNRTLTDLKEKNLID